MKRRIKHEVLNQAMVVNRDQRQRDRTVRERFSLTVLSVLTIASLLSTIVFSYELTNPAVTAKALWLRSFVVLALPFYLYLLMVDPKYRRGVISPLTIAIAAFAGTSLISGMFGVNSSHSFWGDYTRMGGIYQLIHLTLLYFYVVMLARVNGMVFVRRCLQLLVAVASVSSLYAIGIACGMPAIVSDFADDGHFRISSFYGNPVFFATFLIFPTTITVYLWLEAKVRRLRYLYAICFLVQLAGVVLSGTRSAILAVLVGILIGSGVILLNRQRRSIWKAFCLLSATMAVTGLLMFAGHRLPIGFDHIANLNPEGRFDLWRIAWKAFLDRPLLGVGPENYYFVFNKYYRAELYDTPLSLFGQYDKPHNQLLEILVTTGLFGFLAYLAICGLMAYGFYKAFLAKRITWSSMVVLVSGSIVYQISNLFAFQMPADAVAFYVFAAFAGSLWSGHTQVTRWENSRKRRNKSGAAWVFWAAALATCCSIFITDCVTVRCLHNLAQAEAADLNNPRFTKACFDAASQSMFISDGPELASRYEEFVVRLLGTHNVDHELATSALDGATAVLEQTTRRDPTRPEIWLKLAYLYRLKSALNETKPDTRVSLAVDQAIAFGPARFDVWYFAVRHMPLDRRQLDTGIVFAQHLAEIAPYSSQTRWLLASLYHRSSDREDLAAQTANEALQLGYAINFDELPWLLQYYQNRDDYDRVSALYGPARFRWAIDYYADKQDYGKVVALYQNVLRANPNDFQLYERLAAAYFKLGENEKANAAARQAVRLHPAEARQFANWVRNRQRSQ